MIFLIKVSENDKRIILTIVLIQTIWRDKNNNYT